MLKLNDLFCSTPKNLSIIRIIDNEVNRCVKFIESLREDEKVYLLTNVGYEGFSKSWEELFNHIIYEKRILFDENNKRLGFDFYIFTIGDFSSNHIQNTVKLMNKLKIVTTDRSIEDIASMAIRLAILLRLPEYYKDSNTLKTIEYHLCKMFANKE